jgi:integrase
LSNNFANKKNEYGKKYIQSAVLRERQQGEKRCCPHHGTSDNQRDCGAVQLQAECPENALGIKGNRAKGKSKEARDINLALDNIKAQIIKHYQRISDREAFVTAEMVRNAYQGIGSEYETLLKAFDRENEVFKKRVGKDRVMATYHSRVRATTK